ncbi:MAG: DUF6449 domain-containing protein [Lachnospiraceae bacterium]|nr:DUF6449 domain-containing protein [Lachnospiraceae bacterium]
MTSKNSFLVSMKENSKRRLWVWVLSALGFLLALPLYTALRISNARQQLDWLTEELGAGAAEKALHYNLLVTVQETLGTSAILMVLTVVIAIASAVQGFSWLYSRKKIDFYMGMPVKRSKRFGIIWINGILIYLIPYLLGLLLGILVAVGNRCVNAEVFQTVLQSMSVNLLLYLCVYHLTILAVMLTGNIVITGMGFLVFCLYEWLVRRVDYTFKSRFFQYFAYYGDPQAMKFSPFTMYAEIVSGTAAAGSQVKQVILMLIFAALAGGLGFLAYLKRPAEGAGKAMIFPFTKPIIKILLVVPMALTAGDMIANDVNYQPEMGSQGAGYIFFTFALVTVLGCALIQVLYEFDIKGALHKKSHMLISGVFVALIFCCYRYDLLGFDSYVPDPDKVESVAFQPYQYDNADYMDLWYEPEEGAVSGEDYVNQYMHLTNVEDVCGLAEHSMEKYNAFMTDFYQEKNGKEAASDSGAYWSRVRVTYRLKNGREVMRNLWVDVNDETNAGYLDRIIGSDEFKEGYLMGASDRLAEVVKENDRYEVTAYYGNLVYEQKLNPDELETLLQCYREDMEFYNFTRVKESTPAGIIRIEFEREIIGQYFSRGFSTVEMGINIYPFFEKSIACLKDLGIYMERQLNVEDVDRIYITNYNLEADEKLQELQKAEEAEAILAGTTAERVDYAISESSIDARVYANYTERADVEQIADYLYAAGMLPGRWDDGAYYDSDYEVLVYFKAESDMSRKYGTTAHYQFKEGEVPDFVKEDTTFQLPNN